MRKLDFEEVAGVVGGVQPGPNGEGCTDGPLAEIFPEVFPTKRLPTDDGDVANPAN